MVGAVPRLVKLVAGCYAIWVALNIIMAVFNIGDGGVNAYLCLLFTGPPASLLSLYMKSATLPAVVIAGTLGLLQWSAIAWLTVFMERRGMQ